MNRLTFPVLVVLAAALVGGGTASGAKPGPGSSSGVGSVFVPNPVASLGDETLTDQKDADAAVPVAAYHDVTLTNLDGYEYGHAIHFSQGFSFASEQAGAISEGFGDYWAETVSDVVSRADGVVSREPLACIADWTRRRTRRRSRTACAGWTRT